MKLDNEPRLQGAAPSLVDWARKVVQACNELTAWMTSWAFMTPDPSAGNSGPYIRGTAANPTAVLTLDKTTAAAATNAINARRAGVIRWQMNLGNGTAESGSDAGSDFTLNRYSDAGTYLGTPFAIFRSTGQVAMDTAGMTSAGTISTTATHNSTFYSPTGGANLSANYGVLCSGYFTGGGNYFANGMTFNPNWGAITFYGYHVPGVVAGCRFASASNAINFILSTGGAYGSIEASAFTVSSDERIKRDIQPLPANRAGFMAIVPISYKWRDNCQGNTIEGFSAQNLQACIPAAVHGDVTAVDADGKPRPATIDLVPLQAAMVLEVQALIREVAQLRAEIDTLKGAANG